MRKALLIFVLIYSTSFQIKAHETWVHELIIKTAFLKLQSMYQLSGGDTLDLMEMKNMIFNVNNENINYENNFNNKDIWTAPYSIIAGAYTEDYYDPIYDYSLLKYGGAEPVLSHFWNADMGNEYKSSFQYYPFGVYDNSYLKALKYTLGADYNMIDNTENLTNGSYLAYKASIPNIIEFYKTGDANIKGYYILQNDNYKFVSKQQSNVYDIQKRKQIAYNVLGRLLHLLGDLSIPAHVHIQEHPCVFGISDYYELWVAGTDCDRNQPTNYPAIKYANKYQNKLGDNLLSIIDFVNNNDNNTEIIHHLFYVMAQLSDMFYSGGNGIILPNIKGNYEKINSYDAYLDSIYLNVKIPNPKSINQEYAELIADNTFEYCINASASLLYWFGKETNQLNTQINTNITNAHVKTEPKFIINYETPYLTVDGLKNNNGSNLFFKLNDVYGRTLFYDKINSTSNRIYIPNLKTGIYIYSIYNNSALLTSKCKIF